ncbi:Type 2A phosphatase-associated protein 42 [Bonamia ostreae]|uniref:Type 2A phosphatase-associated protein 42 n=1 Tax=Bonamia ostreae TaxID=126728 RepID=A0ABV2AR41_9EUKA
MENLEKYTKITEKIDKNESNPENVKEMIFDLKNCHNKFEKLFLFSKNEEIDDISTNHLPIILCKYYLALLYSKITVTNERSAHIQIALEYLFDFLHFCEEFNLISEKIVNEFEEKSEINISREKLIAQTKKLRILRDYLTENKNSQFSQNEETKRDFYLKKIEYSIENSFCQIKRLKKEQPFALKFSQNNLGQTNFKNNFDRKNFAKNGKIFHIQNDLSEPIEYKNLKEYRQKLEKSTNIEKKILKMTDKTHIFRSFNPPTKLRTDFDHSCHDMNPVANNKNSDMTESDMSSSEEEKDRKKKIEWDTFCDENEKGIGNSSK